MISHCRVCREPLFEAPLLCLCNMPKAAQNLPDAENLHRDAGVDLTVCQCSRCGLVQLPEEPVSYFREVIRAAGISQVLRSDKTRQFANFIEHYGLRGKRIIEVGCGRGEFLTLLEPLEVEAFGLEHSESSVLHCRQNGLRVAKGYLEQEDHILAEGPFDAFLLLMFLEHMPDPNASLRSIARNLTDNAVGLVEVPNFDMVLRNELLLEFISDHLLYFTRDTLETTLRLNGFDVLEWAELRDDYVLSVIVRKRSRAELGACAARLAAIREQLAGFIARFGAKRVAIWGAGHQALATLSLAGIAADIRYVIDSAPFKQGRFTPATHLPIVAPAMLREDPVDAVIVMAASYSDEVAALLRRDYPPELEIAVLREVGLERVN